MVEKAYPSKTSQEDKATHWGPKSEDIGHMGWLYVLVLYANELAHV